MTDLAISVRGLIKRYPGFTLGPIDLDVPCGSIVGFIGENGAGKSTAIRSMLDITHPQAGTVRFFGQALSDADMDLRQHLGVVYDDLYVHATLSAMDLGLIGAKTFSGWQQDTYDSYLRQFSLEPKKRIKDYSRGMKMKLQMAYALSHQARLLILDEPTSGLDPVVREEILDLLLDFIQDERHAVLISTHILSDLEKVADYIALIHGGRMMLYEETNQLRERYGLYACSSQQADALAPEAIVARREHAYGTQLLIRMERMPRGLQIDRPSMEDIMLMMIKGGTKRESTVI